MSVVHGGGRSRRVRDMLRHLVILSAILVPCAEAFSLGTPRPLGGPNRMRARAGICQARMAISDDDVAKWIQKGEEAITDAPKKMKLTPLAKAMNKPTKAMAVATEFDTSFPIGAQTKKETFQILGPQGFSQQLRNLNFNGIFVPIDGNMDAIEALCTEQATAKGNFPGPVSVVMEGVESLEQAAKAKAAGCSAISFRIPQVGASEAQDLVKACQGMQLECVCTTTVDQAEAAVETGAGIVCIDSSDDVAQMKTARGAIPKGTVAIANVAVDIDADNALFEKVREIKEESKFTGVVLRGMFDGSEQDTEVAPWAHGESTSKRSTQIQLSFTGLKTEAARAAGRKEPVYEKPIGPPPDLDDFPPPKPASAPMASNPGAAMPPPAPAQKLTPTGEAGSMYGLMDFAADDPDFDNGFPDDGW